MCLKNARIPSFEELLNEYSKNFKLRSDDTWVYDNVEFSGDGVMARVNRTYPSLIRDIHFLSLCFKSDYFDQVRYSLKDDYFLGVDLKINYDEYEFNLSLHLESKRGNYYKKLKYKRHNYHGTREIVLTLDKKDMKKVSNFHLYTEQHIERLLELVQARIDTEEKILIPELNNFPFAEPAKPAFTYIDLFAGIGGFHLAMNNLNGQCLYSSEWDIPARKTYYHNFGVLPFGDITKPENKEAIPETFDLLCAGFPCQAFSIAGKRGGFNDTRGTLFYEVADIIRQRKPKAIFLENVKGLVNHDRGNTLKTILNVLRNEFHYYVPEPIIINAKNFGVPQNRERIFIVGFREDLGVTEFKYPDKLKVEPTIQDILEENEVSVKYYLSTVYLETLKKHRARHEGKGNGFGYQIIKDDGIANAVVCGGMGRERNLVVDNRLSNFVPVTKIKGEVNREGVRKMTPREWARLQGFPDQFVIPVSDVQAYKQFGNSVAVPAIQATGEVLIQNLLGKL